MVTSSHVVAPWLWPKYYSEEWLKCVNEKHTYYTLELRHDDGTFLVQEELLPRSFHHASKDLAVLHLNVNKPTPDTDINQTNDELGLLAEFNFRPLLLENTAPKPEQPLIFYGHCLTGTTYQAQDDAADDRKPVPMTVEGSMIKSTREQVISLLLLTHPSSSNTTNDESSLLYSPIYLATILTASLLSF